MRGIVGLPLKDAHRAAFPSGPKELRQSHREEKAKAAAKQFTSSTGYAPSFLEYQVPGIGSFPNLHRSLRFAIVLQPGTGRRRSSEPNVHSSGRDPSEHFQLWCGAASISRREYTPAKIASPLGQIILFSTAKFRVFLEVGGFQAKYLLSMNCIKKLIRNELRDGCDLGSGDPLASTVGPGFRLRTCFHPNRCVDRTC